MGTNKNPGVWIAPNINSNDIAWPPTIEQKIDIFYQRALGWQLHIADLLANGGESENQAHSTRAVKNSGFAVLHVCLSYFETVGKIERADTSPPKRGKGYFFKQGVRAVFPQLPCEYSGRDLEELLTKLYVGARCGLYHNSMTMPTIGLGQPDGGDAIGYYPATQELVISPERLPKLLKIHLGKFRARLLDPKEIALRQNFECQFNKDNNL